MWPSSSGEEPLSSWGEGGQGGTQWGCGAARVRPRPSLAFPSSRHACNAGQGTLTGIALSTSRLRSPRRPRVAPQHDGGILARFLPHTLRCLCLAPRQLGWPTPWARL